MVAASRAAAGMGYIGYPAQIFYEKINFNRGPQLHIERLFILDKWYSNLMAYLPIYYEQNKDVDFYNKTIFPKIKEVGGDIDATWDLYKASFEGDYSCDPDELAFIKNLRVILRKLDDITAISRVIDKQKMTDDMDVIG